MKRQPAVLLLFCFAAMFVLLNGFSRIMEPAPGTAQTVAVADAAEIAAVTEARSGLPRDLSLRLQREVDYSAGPAAAWWPKGEAPILRELVADGQLPPVAERVGPEPLVLAGVDGIGNHGGTWQRITDSAGGVEMTGSMLAGTTLFRWNPLVDKVVPHLARGLEVNDDATVFTVRLRRGVRWSDGHPFTADDIMFFWDHDVMDPDLGGGDPANPRIADRSGYIEKVDDYAVRFVFAEPFGFFPYLLAGQINMYMLRLPAHYLRQFHPTLGDPEFIRAELARRGLPDARSLFYSVRSLSNPEHPRLWPWIYRASRSTSPQIVVRNPYYWAVDPAGNQLPYIDRIVFHEKSAGMVPVALAAGESTMQMRHVSFRDYTLLMSQRERAGYEVYHWYNANRSTYLIGVNINRRPNPQDPASAFKAELLRDKRFRQALSLAINRELIAEVEGHGISRPGQLSPGPFSPYYVEELEKLYAGYEPERAAARLDELGLTRRDRDGFRCRPDGGRLVFYLDVTAFTGIGPAQFLVEDWAAVGLRVIQRERSTSLFTRERFGYQQDLAVWIGDNEFLPMLSPGNFVPFWQWVLYAPAYGLWHQLGGLQGEAAALALPEHFHPDPDGDIMRVFRIYDNAKRQPTEAARIKVFQEAMRIAAENVWTINLFEAPPQLVVVSHNMRNVPRHAVTSYEFLSPANAGVETYYLAEPDVDPRINEQIKAELITPVLPARLRVDTAAGGTGAGLSGWNWGRIFFRGAALGFAVLLILLSIRYSFVAHRLCIMIPTLLIMSVIVFTIIQLPPGSFLDTRIQQLQESGATASAEAEIANLTRMFHLDAGPVERYARWMGFSWFLSFDKDDTGLLQGNLGRSMESLRPVNEIVGDRILFTVLLSLGTILFTWAVAIPIGILSAARQYTRTDYALTLTGFIGMSVPDFLLALLLVYLGGEFFGVTVTGLFSPEYAAMPGWSWGKVLDMLKHIWLPIIVLGVSSTAGMIRVMRANLLDELKKPYVVTGRAKGLRPVRLLLKYPVRIALNPFISGIGGLFPALLSGGSIVAIVLSLPTIGPLMVNALMSQDMYLAGSMLMVFSLLGVIGTLVSDLLLLWLDPRIRFEKGGAK